MKRLWRWALRLLVVLVVLLVAGVLLLDTFTRIFIARQIRNRTGLETKIGRVHVGLRHPEITIENLVVYNTAEFGGSPFILLPELHVDYDRAALFSDQFHFQLIRLNLNRINLVEDKNGRRNFDFLQPKNTQTNAVQKSPHKSFQPVRGAARFEFTGIDTLNLTLGKATYTRLGQTNQPDELDLKMNHQIFPHVNSEQDFYSLLFIIYLTSDADTTPGSSQNWLQLISPPKK